MGAMQACPLKQIPSFVSTVHGPDRGTRYRDDEDHVWASSAASVRARRAIDLRGYREVAQQSSMGAIDAAQSRARDHQPRRPPGAASEGSPCWRAAPAAAASLARADSLRTGEDLRLAPDTESKGSWTRAPDIVRANQAAITA